MKRLFKGFALTSLLSLAACGSAKFYTLPVNGERAAETQSLIGVCATELGLESYKADDFVSVKYDDTASLYYRYQGGDSATLQVLVDDKKLPPPEVERKQAEAKAKSDQIYSCVQSRLYPQQPAAIVVPAQQPVVVVQQPAPQAGVSIEMKTDMSGMSMKASSSTSTTTTTTQASATVGVGGTCAQALECYSQLHKAVCEGQSNCSFKAEIKGNSDSACHQALVQANETVKQMSMFKPGLTTPQVCRVDE